MTIDEITAVWGCVPLRYTSGMISRSAALPPAVTFGGDDVPLRCAAGMMSQAVGHLTISTLHKGVQYG